MQPSPVIGWDRDQFLTDIGVTTMVMLSVIRNGGLASGGFNFDAKLRRESTDVEDLFIAHISGMDTVARGLCNAAKLIEDGSMSELIRKCYESFDTELGAIIGAGKADFEMLEKKVMELGEPYVASGKQTGTTSKRFGPRDKLEMSVVFGIAASTMEELLEMAEAGQPL